MIVFTSQAEQNLRVLMQEDKEAVGLRIYVPGRGCHGYHYGMAFESKIGEEDTVIEKGDLTIILDSHSVPLRNGTEVDDGGTACKAPDWP